ncbi:hypothetical protein [Streptomyces olivaceoviridis]|uniref:hypothetical protein n=1 Tax=Streptomyces olivaceoviridis TaxID=1921 RepID=UPI0036CECA90
MRDHTLELLVKELRVERSRRHKAVMYIAAAETGAGLGSAGPARPGGRAGDSPSAASATARAVAQGQFDGIDAAGRRVHCAFLESCRVLGEGMGITGERGVDDRPRDAARQGRLHERRKDHRACLAGTGLGRFFRSSDHWSGRVVN